MKIEIYSKEGCGYCVRAKDHFKNHGLPFTEYKLGEDVTREDIQARVPEGIIVRQIPQIFIDGEYIGGYMDMTEWFLARTKLKEGEA